MEHDLAHLHLSSQTSESVSSNDDLGSSAILVPQEL